MSKKNNDTASANALVDNTDSAQRLDAIKNLIFGENIQQIDQEFEAIKAHVEKRRSELQDLIDQTNKELHAAIDNLTTDLNIRITDLDTKVDDAVDNLEDKKVDRSTLGHLLVSMGEKIMKD